MTANGWFQISLYVLAIFLVTKPLGIFMARVFGGQKTFLDPVLRPVERLIYRLCGVDEKREMRWTEYGAAMLLFSGVSLIFLYLTERMQQWLPLNPQKFANVPPALAWNTAVSFTTNTNWQAYVPETTMSYLTQMAGLAYHNFASAAVGIALAIALIRGITRRESGTIGNFWVDLTRCFLWVLLPVCLVGSLFLISQGVVQNFRPYDQAAVVEPQRVSTTGADSNPGTQTSPWRTVQHAADTVRAGSTVNVRGGVYEELVSIKASGNATDGYITFRSYPGETAVLDAEHFAPDGRSGILTIHNKSYVRIEGFEIRNFRTAEHRLTPLGISVIGAGSHIELLKNKGGDPDLKQGALRSGNRKVL